MDIDKLRILLVSPLPPPAGGIASWTQKYFTWAKENHISVDVVNTAVIGRRANRINDNRNLLDEIIRTTKIIRVLRQKIRTFQPDVIHLNSPCGKLGIIRDYLCASIICRRRKKLIVHYRCNVNDQISSKIQRFFFKRLTQAANLVLVLNSSSQEYIRKIAGKESRLVANFIDNRYIIDQPKYIATDIKQIVTIGHVQRTKGSKEIIETARLFPEITFTLAGPISSEISSLEIPENVELPGPINQVKVRDLLYNADIFLLPTYTEGFSNALLEAMAMGVPIITTPVGANADMIEKFGGVLVRVGNIHDIVDAINVMGDCVLRENMSCWNVSKVKNNYIIDSVMNLLLGIYQEAVGDEY